MKINKRKLVLGFILTLGIVLVVSGLVMKLSGKDTIDESDSVVTDSGVIIEGLTFGTDGKLVFDLYGGVDHEIIINVKGNISETASESLCFDINYHHDHTGGDDSLCETIKNSTEFNLNKLNGEVYAYFINSGKLRTGSEKHFTTENFRLKFNDDSHNKKLVINGSKEIPYLIKSNLTIS